MTGTLLSLGHGYSAAALEPQLLAAGWTIIATTRSPEKLRAMQARGLEAMLWPGNALPLGRATHLLTSIAPRDGDPVLAAHGAEIAQARHLAWIGYLSTVGVYGDRQGGWVDEDSARDGASARARARIEAEDAWQALCDAAGLRLHIIRLAGIYGPGRGPFEKLRDGRAQMVIKPGQVFSRIHREDIAQALWLAMQSDLGSRAFNLCDDAPAPPQDVLRHAAGLLGITPPPEVPFDQAELSPMARSFYGDSKRVRNDRIKRELGLKLRHPDYQSGLAAILRDEE
ncbi:MAG: SDR family oxidoreductase [Rhodobacteraceae bacterium]|nr:MAG: SDR family oxidoreductase [Paracoccaceae bacterium]